MQRKGIDISEFQRVKDFALLKTEAEFVMLRAGFGFCTIDSEFFYNIHGLDEQEIPYGCYWFSYALSVDDAKKEAEYFCDLMDKYASPELPLYIDWEYDSERYAKQHGVNMTGELLRKIVIAFLNVCNDRGYTAGVYTNPDYIQRFFYSAEWLRNIGSLWLASWGIDEPVTCDIWQYTSKGSLQSISGNVDMDICYIDLHHKPTEKTVEECLSEILSEYDDICYDIMTGAYGSGEERKKKLGKYYDVAQKIINQAYLRKDGEF